MNPYTLNPIARSYALEHLRKAKVCLGKVNTNGNTTMAANLTHQREAAEHIDMAISHLASPHGDDGYPVMVRDAIGHLHTIAAVINAMDFTRLHPHTLRAISTINDSAEYAFCALTGITNPN